MHLQLNRDKLNYLYYASGGERAHGTNARARQPLRSSSSRVRQRGAVQSVWRAGSGVPPRQSKGGGHTPRRRATPKGGKGGDAPWLGVSPPEERAVRAWSAARDHAERFSHRPTAHQWAVISASSVVEDTMPRGTRQVIKMLENLCKIYVWDAR
jgi:hypothetical protein